MYCVYTDRMADLVTSASRRTLSEPTDRWDKVVLSSIWWNSYAERWDGVIPRDDGGGSGSDHYVVKDVGGTESYVVEVETRNTSRVDAFWDDTGKQLFVARGHGTAPLFSRVTYNDGTDTYALDGSVTDIALPTSFTYGADNNDDEPLATYMTPNGDVWVAIMTGTALYVSKSTDNGATWTAASAVVSVSNNGPVGMGHFENAGITYLIVVGMEDSGTGANVYSIDEDAANLASGNWTNESAGLPSFVNSSDNHVCVRSYNDTTYVAFKESGGDEVLSLWVRTAAGSWTAVNTIADVSTLASRPSLLIDATHNTLFYLWGTTAAGTDDVSFKAADLASLSSLASGSATVLLDASALSGPPGFNDGAVTPRGGVTVPPRLLASDFLSNNIWWSDMPQVVPNAPSNPAAAADSSSQITVTWDNVTGETGFRVERSPNGSTGWTDVSGNLAVDTTSYADTGLTAATQYFYRVYAFNAAGDSDPSTTVNATTDAASGGGNRMGGTGAIRKPPRR